MACMSATGTAEFFTGVNPPKELRGGHQRRFWGRECRDNILVHVDKDGRLLCGEEFCPLHRSMRTGKRSSSPTIVFGQTRSGGRIHMAVSVAPIRDNEGNIIGGVETFSDFTETCANLVRAKTDPNPFHGKRTSERQPSRFFQLLPATRYDRWRLFCHSATRRGSLWTHACRRNGAWSGRRASYHAFEFTLEPLPHQTITHPAEFARLLNRDLCRIVKDESFATGICGVFCTLPGKPCGLSRREVRLWYLYARMAGVKIIDSTGCPFGMFEASEYDEHEYQCASGDTLLMFTDGATEIHDVEGRLLGTEGLLRILDSLGYPENPPWD